MAMEKPLLASDVGGHLETVIEDVNGKLFRADDLDDLVDKLTGLIVNDQFRMDLGLKARVWVKQNLDWNILVKKYSTIYERLLS